MVQNIRQVSRQEDKLLKIRPLIKWTGGKYREYRTFSTYIPAFNNYYEPFFGGGGVFFAHQPSGKAFLNDKSKDLVTFYSLLKSSEFKKQLLDYVKAWNDAGRFANDLSGVLIPIFENVILEGQQRHEIYKLLEQLVFDKLQGGYFFIEEHFILYAAKFKAVLVKSLADKFSRVTSISKRGKRPFTHLELHQHIETGIKSGLYLFLRSLTNDVAKGKILMSVEKKAANWYYVREFCYASMFRYNSKGGFNIPYGGIAYNKKNFALKVDKLFAGEVQSLFANSSFTNLDFEEFLLETKPAASDFIFLDPPYDSEFSEYDQNAFTRQDQVRLRNVLLTLPAKWMMVIKETPFIRELYNVEACQLIDFDKTYTYNVRGRNNRDTRHLIIANYTI
ncbi:MAG: adenine methylase [Segetibacter sp.]|nr:adenine methylase [Segetibacter sp.]